MRKMIALMCLVFLACGKEEVVPTEFVRLYAELRVATQEWGETSQEARRERLRILEKHGYTWEKYDSVMAWLEVRPQLWQPLLDSIVQSVSEF
jgi:hypothetical protein